MLYNPNWNKKKSKDWKSLDNLIAWLETQPADGYYCYTDSGNCMLAQYLRAQGKKAVSVNSMYATFANSWKFWSYGSSVLPSGFDLIARRNHRFGDALKDALKMAKTLAAGQALERAKALRNTSEPKQKLGDQREVAFAL